MNSIMADLATSPLAMITKRDGDIVSASMSLYGYVPNLPWTAFFLAVFLLSSCFFVIQSFIWRGWWGFGIAMILGTLLEFIGYIARALLSQNPNSDLGLKLNIVLLNVAPAFLTAGIYLLFKQFCVAFGPQHSLLDPSYYSYVFVSCDILSIILQGLGGSVAVIGATHGKLVLDVGSDILLGGLIIQVVTLVIFAALAIHFTTRCWRNCKSGDATASLRNSTRFRLFVGAVVVSFLLILIRCCFRVAELNDGWGSKTMRNEGGFIGLESCMIALACILLNIFHPGYCFKRPNTSDLFTMAMTRESIDDRDHDEEEEDLDGDRDSAYEMMLRKSDVDV